MTEPTYHHICLLVPDLEKAVAWYADILGVRFRDPQRVTTRGRIDPYNFGDDDPHESESYLSWSIDGPPYYELGEIRGTGIHSAERHGVGIHHVGIFVDDVDAKISELAAKGIGTEARMLAPDGTTLCCWAERGPETGLMVEYLSEVMRPAIQGWIERGEMPVTASSEVKG
jgi:catechol 2,3-dioxygenase-like lactoylglutathione lyase family enzyme